MHDKVFPLATKRRELGEDRSHISTKNKSALTRGVGKLFAMKQLRTDNLEPFFGRSICSSYSSVNQTIFASNSAIGSRPGSQQILHPQPTLKC